MDKAKNFKFQQANMKFIVNKIYLTHPLNTNSLFAENETKTLTAQYKNKSYSSILMNVGVGILFLISGLFSQYITEYFGINHLWWIPIYALFIILILWLMKAAKIFTIYISE